MIKTNNSLFRFLNFSLFLIGLNTYMTAQQGVLDPASSPIKDGPIGAYQKENSENRYVVPYVYVREADVTWTKRVWRTLDIRERRNQVFKYPLEESRDRTSFIQLIIKQLGAEYNTADKTATFDGKKAQYSSSPPIAYKDDAFLEPWDKNEILKKAVVHGKVILSSGKEADYYVDLRRVTLDSVAAPLVGEVMLDLTKDWDFDAVGGLTLGADPVATAMMHFAAKQGRKLDSFVVRKAEKAHGLQRRIEGPDVKGRRVLAVEDTSTTGSSVLTAVEALKEAGAIVVGVAVIVERGAAGAVKDAGLEYRAAYSLQDLGL